MGIHLPGAPLFRAPPASTLPPPDSQSPAPGGIAGDPDMLVRIVDATPDAMIVVDDRQRIVFVNAQTEKLFGWARGELLGRPLDLLIPPRLRAAHAGHSAGYANDARTRAMGEGLEVVGLHRDGTELAVEVSLAHVPGREGLVMAVVRDTGERRRVVAASEVLSQRLASAVEAIQDGFALFDDDGQFVLCNSVYRRHLGETLPGPLVGRSHRHVLEAWQDDISFADDASRARFLADRAPSRSSEPTVFDLQMRDGRSLRLVERPTPEGGTVATVWDLTEDVRLAGELRAALAAADAANDAKSEFLSSMSHELRTPLNAILGFAQLLQRDRKEPLSERHRGRVDQIVRGGEHLLRLIDDILDLARIERQGGVSISSEPVDVVEAVAAVRATLEPLASTRSIRLVYEPPSAPACASADPTRLSQILINLGSNAIKYDRDGGTVTFALSTPTAGQVRIHVRDTGPGIPPEQQAKLFQPFQRAGQEAGPVQGTGIGLVITKRLARMMNGDVGFRSTPGVGSEFWVDLPAHEAAPRTSPVPPVRAPRARRSRSGRKLVLYVEDNAANVAFMHDLVSSLEGVDLLVAPDGERGVVLARERSPHVILMDINLPGMSGLDALRVLHGAPETRSIPVIALTAAASPADRRKGMAAGFYSYFAKPLQVDELVTTIDRLLETSPGIRSE
jgi:PAS domain S-box-containing protein